MYFKSFIVRQNHLTIDEAYLKGDTLDIPDDACMKPNPGGTSGNYSHDV